MIQGGLMCGLECSKNEECRYEKENCEYKCYFLPELKIWTSVAAVAGIVIIGAIVFFVVRHLKNKTHIQNTINVEKQPDYEVPYTMNGNGSHNRSVNIENAETYEAYQSAEYETYDEMYAEPYADNKNGR